LEIEAMAEAARGMFSQAIEAFKQQNADQARATMVMAKQVGHSFEMALADLMRLETDIRIKAMFAHFVVFNMLERVADQSKNICEEAVFAVTGQQKAPKVYRILFLDEDNSCLGPMAVAIARKNYAAGGNFTTGGRNPSDALMPVLADFMDARGHDMDGCAPAALDYSPQEVGDLHVIVSLQNSVSDYLETIPFHTVALDWDIGPCPESQDPEDTARQCEAIYRELSLQLRDLMHLLRGDEAH
jgi:protein-tyrosine-phosphatase